MPGAQPRGARHGTAPAQPNPGTARPRYGPRLAAPARTQHHSWRGLRALQHSDTSRGLRGAALPPASTQSHILPMRCQGRDARVTPPSPRTTAERSPSSPLSPHCHPVRAARRMRPCSRCDDGTDQVAVSPQEPSETGWPAALAPGAGCTYPCHSCHRPGGKLHRSLQVSL